MPLILNIETSSPVCSVCLAKDGEVMDYREDHQGNSHARILTVFIQDLMNNKGVTLNQLDAVAVSAGPGSYTGMRIGLATAKGLCYALKKPLVAVPTLLSMAAAMAKRFTAEKAVYMPALDARRMDIYTAVFDAAGNELLKTQAVTVNETLANKLAAFKKVFVFGSGAEKCKSVFTSQGFEFINDIACDARFLAPLSYNRFVHHQFEDIAYFEPWYLKEFGAK